MFLIPRNLEYLLCAGCCSGVEGLGTKVKGHGIEFGRTVRDIRPERESRSYAEKLQRIPEFRGFKNVLLQVTALMRRPALVFERCQITDSAQRRTMTCHMCAVEGEGSRAKPQHMQMGSLASTPETQEMNREERGS